MSGDDKDSKHRVAFLPASMRRAGDADQLELIERIKEDEADGIGVGILRDGTPFLTQRGLANLCGVQNAHIGTIGTEWNEPTQKPRISIIKDLLNARGVNAGMPYIRTTVGNKVVYAYPEKVCSAILEYYAYAAGANCQPEAVANFRRLAAGGLQAFIYKKLGYRPVSQRERWQQFYDRVSLVYDNVPSGHFSVFKEIATVIVTLLNGGVPVGEEILPDISVGQHWAKHWQENGFERQFGARKKYLHNYPEYFPQAGSNPQEPYCYPNAALPEFRRWMEEVYLKTKLPTYLTTQERRGKLPPRVAETAISALTTRRKAITR